MKKFVLIPAVVLAAAMAPGLVCAQPAGYAITGIGADWRVLSKTTVEHGTNRVHQYTELATGMNYQDSYGQWTESKEEITLLPTGGAVANQGRHTVSFPADIYNGVLEVVTPDGRHLKSRPLGIFYDDGSNTVMIAQLKHSVGWLTSSNQVTYRDAFTEFKADLVCTYRRSGFECDLVFRQQPPTPEACGLDPAGSTLQMITEFFNTQDPQAIPAAADGRHGLQDHTLKFGKLTMRQGKAFAFKSPRPLGREGQGEGATRVYKRWLHVAGRAVLIEEVPLAYLTDDLDALPLTASASPGTRRRFASQHREFPPAHEFVADTNQIMLASAGLNQEPGVVLDYDEIVSDQTDFTFQSGMTYYVNGDFNLNGTTTFEEGTVIKFGDEVANGLQCYGDIVCPPDPASPAIFTTMDDDSVGEVIDGSSGTPTGGPNYLAIISNVTSLKNLRMSYANCCIDYWSDNPLFISDSQFFHCDYNEALGFYNQQTVLHLNNVLFSQCVAISYNELTGDDGFIHGNHVTVDQSAYGACLGGDMLGSETCAAYFTNSIFTAIGDTNGLILNHSVLLASGSGVYQTGADAHYYLAPDSPYRNIGTTNINPDLLAELQTMTTYAPQDGGFPDTNAPDLGYHYPVNEDSDYDGLPDAWEYYYYGSYSLNGTNLDGNGNTLLSDYQNGADPNVINFTVRLGNQHFNTTNATGSYLVLGGVPSYEAVLVNDTNFNDAVWSNYDGTVRMNLGPTDGVYQVWLGLKGFAANATPTWTGTTVYLDRVAPVITLTSATNRTVAVPYLQLPGYAGESLQSVTYDLSNAVAVVTNQPGSLTGQFFDTNTFEYTTNYFQCFDILLTNGLNLITVHATDLAGNVTVTNLNYTLDYTIATNPVVRLFWPQNGQLVSGSNFTWRGWVDDPTATVSATITDASGDTNSVSALVDRNGNFWAAGLPLAAGTNWLTLNVTNAAGLASETNILVIQSPVTVTINPVTDDLWQPTVNVSGTISDPTYAVWVNGVAGINNGDGTWSASGVPVDPGGSTTINATVYPPGDSPGGGSGSGGSGGGSSGGGSGGSGGGSSGGGSGGAGSSNPSDSSAPSAELDLDKPSAVILDSAHWTFDSKEYAPDGGLGPVLDTYHTQGDYTHAGGGSYLEHDDFLFTNGTTTASETVCTLAPDGSTTEIYTVNVAGWSDQAYVYGGDGLPSGIHFTDSGGDDFYYIVKQRC